MLYLRYQKDVGNPIICTYGGREMDSGKIGSIIAAKRKALGLTQQALAERLHISFQAVSKWENGVSLR